MWASDYITELFLNQFTGYVIFFTLQNWFRINDVVILASMVPFFSVSCRWKANLVLDSGDSALIRF